MTDFIDDILAALESSDLSALEALEVPTEDAVVRAADAIINAMPTREDYQDLD